MLYREIRALRIYEGATEVQQLIVGRDLAEGACREPQDARNDATFERPVRIRFSHCDPAGIVFFPQYLVMTNALVEDWFNEGTADRLRADDRATPRRLADRQARLRVFAAEPDGRNDHAVTQRRGVGRRSISIEIVGHATAKRASARNRCSSRHRSKRGTSIDIPADIASALARVCSTAATSIEAHRS